MITMKYSEYPESLTRTLEPHFGPPRRTSASGDPLYRHVHVQSGRGRLLQDKGYVCQRMFPGEVRLRRLALTRDPRVAALAAAASEFDDNLLTQSSMAKWLQEMTSPSTAAEWIERTGPHADRIASSSRGRQANTESFRPL